MVAVEVVLVLEVGSVEVGLLGEVLLLSIDSDVLELTESDVDVVVVEVVVAVPDL